jgi:hypothetical protein
MKEKTTIKKAKRDHEFWVALSETPMQFNSVEG